MFRKFEKNSRFLLLCLTFRLTLLYWSRNSEKFLIDTIYWSRPPLELPHQLSVYLTMCQRCRSKRYIYWVIKCMNIIVKIYRYLHFINIMAYDLHGAYDGVTGENAPLYPSSHDVTPVQKEANVVCCLIKR